MVKRFSLFGAVALIVLLIGCVGAKCLWFRFHHRYDTPNTGFYHGSVRLFFEGTEEAFFWVSIRSETPSRWCWTPPTNFSYSTFAVDWSREESSDGHAIVNSPAFTYCSGESAGKFTRDVLASWLYGPTNQPVSKHLVDSVFGYIEAAARGALPPPRHHPYYFEQPVRVCITHFLDGYGVSSADYVWLLVWLCSVVFYGRKVWRGKG